MARRALPTETAQSGPQRSCRVCGAAFFDCPLLRYDNMPKAAQGFPAAGELADDRGELLEVCQCSGCGLVQLSSEPVPYYREVIRAAAFSAEMQGFRSRQFVSFVRDHALGGKKVLEVGCGRGEYLALMQQAGADAHGLEASAAAVSCCRDSGLKAMQGFVEGVTERIDHAPFAAFFMLNFLEHLPDPNATLRGIGNNLEEGAVGLVEVPNFDMILRRKLFSEFISDHLCYFTRETLSQVLTVNGFELIGCDTIWHDYILSAVVRKRRPLDVLDFQACQDRLKAELDVFVGRFGAKRVAIWGAGHQALAVIALTKVAEHIRYVVDSAPFKQGRYTPATHLPIVAPDTLAADPVDAVIVMAASYADEVAGILRRDHDPKLTVAILRENGLQELPRTTSD